MNTIAFPGLGLEFSVNPISFTLLGHSFYWYGTIIACGFLLAVLYCRHRAPEFGVEPDHLIDMLLYAVPLSIVGARLYYVVFYLDLYRNANGSLDVVRMVRIWDGGLAIYGAVIAAVLTVLVFTRHRGFSFLAWTDMGVFGLLIGQTVGRWGNFVNVEAYGGPTELPWRMGIYEWVGGAYQYVEVHPTFLYESLWNLLGLLVLIHLSKKGRRRFDGMLFATYILWYGFGRGCIEGLRTDSLYLFGSVIRVSQLLGFASAVAAAIYLFYHLRVKKHTPEELYVNRLKREKEEREERNHGDDSGREGPGGQVQEEHPG
ncbi:Prolipoprotein diacylglyceryl transferase [bioreactor metagenome]|uniref:Prolipoprotein diacylglyceryl transferase n=1 Tax=bioreactor metagenome TaxID=1076179 RepID=A0A644ZGW3_9ZZZZ